MGKRMTRRTAPDDGVPREKRPIALEQWKVVPGASWIRVSNLGRLKRNGKIVRKLCTDKDGYYRLNIKGRGTVRFHRLVAELWLPNPDKLPVVDHIDADKQNNCVLDYDGIDPLSGEEVHYKCNLRWCTIQENTQYAAEMGLLANKALYQPFACCDEDGKVELFASCVDMCRKKNLPKQAVYDTANGKRKNVHGYRVWKVTDFIDRRGEIVYGKFYQEQQVSMGGKEN